VDVTRHLAVWLIPDEPARSQLAALIEAWSSALRTPPFPAHVTLLGGARGWEAEVLQRLREAALETPAVPLRLARAAHTGEYFRCVFLEAVPALELLSAHQRARRALGGGPDRFQPHLSLVYGRLPGPRREELAREAERELPLPLDLSASRIELLETRGAPGLWRRCGGFDLGR
jgi:2'-5' RNA ligase